MDIDLAVLRWAKVPALERLAASLGVDVPKVPAGGYERRLARAVAHAIEADKRRAAVEERRAMDKAERRKVAVEIAAALGETWDRPRRQIERIVGLMGPEWARDHVVRAAAAIDLCDDLTKRRDGQPRTRGGVFFEACRAMATLDVVAGKMTRREFFRCFTDQPRKSREPKPAPKPKGARRTETPVKQAQGKPRRQVIVPEVGYVRRAPR